jgi:hypothetical protein
MQKWLRFSFVDSRGADRVILYIAAWRRRQSSQRRIGASDDAKFFSDWNVQADDRST